ncbi:Hypothetical predicted protein [Olea europaea subsp. europaea]|uniref:Uncharacterized protein n=1 Tax=Olea europaea subsp. europaea TaxID=158383 RepID=A0A8S0RV72_OLEEU|nr:Hypothetical predicted protein [Olea europaea subsp. europaea]
MDTIVAKETEKSEVHSVGDVPQQKKVTDIQQNIDKKGKGKMDPTDEIEYPSFPPTSSFNLGVVSTPIISNEVDAIIAGVVKDCEIEEQVDVATKTVNEDQGSSPSAPTSGLPIKRVPKPTRILQSPYVIGVGKQIKHSDDAIVLYKHADKADVVAFQKIGLTEVINQEISTQDCGIIVIKYAEYMLRDDIKSMQMNFDASRVRLDIATRLFKHKDIKKPTQFQSKGESIVIE